LENLIRSIDPSLVNDKRVAVIGAADLSVPLLIDAHFQPACIDAVDAHVWRYTFQNVWEQARRAKCRISLYPVAEITADELRATGATPWDIVFCCTRIEELEHPLVLLEDLAALTANALVLSTSLSIDHELPLMMSNLQTNRLDHMGACWHMSPAFADSYMRYIGFHAAYDLVAVTRGDDGQSGRRSEVLDEPEEYCKVWMKL
jgi:hypothetical protein